MIVVHHIQQLGLIQNLVDLDISVVLLDHIRTTPERNTPLQTLTTASSIHPIIHLEQPIIIHLEVPLEAHRHEHEHVLLGGISDLDSIIERDRTAPCLTTAN